AGVATYHFLPETLNPLTANALILVHQPQANWRLPSGDPGTFKLNQVERMKTRKILEKALSDPSVNDQSRERMVADLEKQLRVEVKPGTDYIDVSWSGHNGKRVATVVNAVV